MSLEKFGWNSHFAAEFARLGEPGLEPARVALFDRERFLVWSATGEHEAVVSGRLRHEAAGWPAVGDWVTLETNALIAAILSRQTAFSRKQAGMETRGQVIA